MARKHDVFLSYNSHDEEIVLELAEALRQRGLKVWLDQWELVPGHPWQPQVEDAIRAVRAAAVVMGKKGLGRWEEPEMRAFLEECIRRKLPVIPVLLPNAANLPIFLRGHTWVDLRDGTTPESIDRLVWGIRGHKVDWTPYVKDVLDRSGHIDIRGVASAGSTRGALRPRIERLYTPLRSHELAQMEGDLADGGLVDLLSWHRLLLIEGQPGAGKTTFLSFVTAMLARDVLREPCPDASSWRRRHLGMEDDEPALLPVFLRIYDLLPFLTTDASSLRHDGRAWLLDALDEMVRINGYGVERAAWREALEVGTAILLLDGLDEVADETVRERLFNIFRDASESWRCRIVVTSRPIQTAALVQMGFHTDTVKPFGEREIRLFIDHWVAALHDAPSAADLGGAGERYQEDLLEAIVGWPQVRQLATNPVMLTCLCVVHWNEGRLPEGRSRVYRAVIRWLLLSRRERREEEGWNDYFAEQALARLALAMLTAPEGKQTVFDLEAAAVAVAPVVHREHPGLDAEERRSRSRRWLRFECLGSGIIEEVPGSRVRFWHLTFQEFLAARQLAWRGDGDDPDEDWWPLVRDRLDDAQWREIVELFPGCLLDEGGVGRADRLLDRVLALRGDGGELASEARIAGIVGRLLRPLEVYRYRPRPAIAAAYEEALERSMAIFTREGAAEVSVEVRIAAAEALGQGGDPRLTGYEDHLIEVPGCGGLRLGKYPVTVEEYRRFVDHRGYEEQRHWSPEGWALKKKKSWKSPSEWEKQLATPNRPVVSVSWYEAEAYCRWWSEQRGEDVRLPREADWRKAATPKRGPYPWGEAEPDAERANFAPEWRSNVEAPTPVGIYPAGNGPYGHCDLAGNVWEWSTDGWKGPKDEGKVLRGGSWSDPALGLRAAIRVRHPASDRDTAFGFRVAVSPPGL